MLSTVIVSGLASASTRWWRRREPGPGIGRPAGRTHFLCSHRVQCWALWARKQEKLWLVVIALSLSSTHHLKTHSQLGMVLPNETGKTVITVPLPLLWVGFSICKRNSYFITLLLLYILNRDEKKVPRFCTIKVPTAQCKNTSSQISTALIILLIKAQTCYQQNEL